MKMLTAKALKTYAPGKDCKCAAWCESECGCDVDWTPKEIYELRLEVKKLKRELRRINETWRKTK